MKWICFLLILLLVTSCKKQEVIETHDVLKTSDTLPEPTKTKPIAEIPRKYSNERFKDVTVESVGENKFRVKGKGQIFEASFSWVIEDGHNELQKGFQMTDAGAPEWGNFDFTIEASKKEENSTLTLILFEASAKDGSRQYELPIALD
ncbi:Gmad2 immunoglobulin-like domain-containing protein [Flavobacterium sp.]|uniref:Gmad2 immunoglobulin-like domain-containing protein n=1 Tax=Flavobacterium sp. TaxID=239 RepID=UPI0025DB984F|nr:Gmad2 immunoglobulin-like domain-containing protein [Flavobacterium sp.]